MSFFQLKKCVSDRPTHMWQIIDWYIHLMLVILFQPSDLPLCGSGSAVQKRMFLSWSLAKHLPRTLTLILKIILVAVSILKSSMKFKTMLAKQLLSCFIMLKRVFSFDACIYLKNLLFQKYFWNIRWDSTCYRLLFVIHVML